MEDEIEQIDYHYKCAANFEGFILVRRRFAWFLEV